MDDAEVLAPAGFETIVPALQPLRASLWKAYGKRLQAIFELGDYLGLERAVTITRGDFDSMRYMLPHHVWDRCNAMASNPSYENSPNAALFLTAFGRPMDVASIVAEVSCAMRTSKFSHDDGTADTRYLAGS